MKYITFTLFFSLFLSSLVFADERKSFFKGLDSEILSIFDDMTDEKLEGIRVDFREIYMAIYGDSDLAIWADSDDLNFSFEGTHLIRVGKNKPFSLKSLNRQKTLRLTSAAESEAVIKALAKGEEIKLRYYTWPQHEKIDKKLQHPGFGFIYNKAVKLFGWKDFGVSSELGPGKIDVYKPTDPDSKGYAIVWIKGNSDLELSKGFDKYGGGATIMNGFGIHKGKWVSGNVISHENKEHLIIRDLNGDIVFKELFPSYNRELKFGKYYLWPIGKTAAKKAWEYAPSGSIEIEQLIEGKNYNRKAFLYGFRELWKWGIDNADFPSLE